MKILLTSHYFKEFRGTQLFNITLAKELKRLGNDVFYYTFEKGEASRKMDEYASEANRDDRYDLMIGSHISCYRDMMHTSKTRVFISHGIISSLDVPPNDCLVLAVSEEVRKRFDCKGLIMNPVDLERFTPGGGKGIVYLASEPQQEMIKILDKYPHKIVGSGTDVWDIPTEIRGAGLVVSAARGVIEAMACKVPALVYKSTGFDGYCGEYWELNRHNFSGRRYNKLLTPESFEYEMNRATKESTEKCYKYVLDTHDVKKVVERLLRSI